MAKEQSMNILTALRTKRFWLIFMVLVAVIFGFRFATSKATPDPLAGFHFSSLNNLDSNKAITADYQGYIKNLSLNKGDFVGSVDYSENGSGQHAVQITIGIHRKWWNFGMKSGTWWEHFLIYDKNNKRIKVIKRRGSDYVS